MNSQAKELAYHFRKPNKSLPNLKFRPSNASQRGPKKNIQKPERQDYEPNQIQSHRVDSQSLQDRTITLQSPSSVVNLRNNDGVTSTASKGSLGRKRLQLVSSQLRQRFQLDSIASSIQDAHSNTIDNESRESSLKKHRERRLQNRARKSTNNYMLISTESVDNQTKASQEEVSVTNSAYLGSIPKGKIQNMTQRPVHGMQNNDYGATTSTGSSALIAASNALTKSSHNTVTFQQLRLLKRRIKDQEAQVRRSREVVSTNGEDDDEMVQYKIGSGLQVAL